MHQTTKGNHGSLAARRRGLAHGMLPVVIVHLAASIAMIAQPAAPPVAPSPAAPSPARLVEIIREAAARMRDAPGMRRSYDAFLEANGLPDGEPLHSRFCTIRILFEAARDAGFWNLHWAITNREPNSDNVWRRWAGLEHPAAGVPTATAECDELSALFAFLARQLGVRGVGLFWPTSNHTVAVWVIPTSSGREARIVVPTTQIFLSEADRFGTRTFDPWKQRTIHEYNRQDAPSTLRLPARLITFLGRQIDHYAGADDDILQRLRYLRAAVFDGAATPGEAAMSAAALLPTCTTDEDRNALDHFVRDIKTVE